MMLQMLKRQVSLFVSVRDLIKLLHENIVRKLPPIFRLQHKLHYFNRQWKSMLNDDFFSTFSKYVIYARVYESVGMIY